MNSMRKKLSVTLCLSQIALMCGIANPAFCLPSSTASEETQLASYEKTLFGQAQPSGPTESRLDALEKNLFGAPKSGPATTRLASIGKALSGSKSDFLLPPIAPKYDFSSGSSNGSNSSNSSDRHDSAKSSSNSSAAASTGRSDDEPTSTMDDASKQALQQATALYSQGRTPEAENAFRHVLTLNSRSVDAYFNLGVISETRGDLQRALNYYQSASRLNPSDQELQDAVTAVQSKIAQKIAADERNRSQQQQAAELSRGQQSRDNLKQIAADAQAAYKSGNFDKAISNLSMVAAQAPNDPDVQYALAQAYKGKGDLQNSRNSLNRALAIDPNNRLYQTAMSQLNSRGSAPQATGATGGAPSPGSTANSYGQPNDDNSASRPFRGKLPYSYNGASNNSSGAAQTGWQPTDEASTGQLTPFTSQGESSLPGGGYQRGGVNGSGASGFFAGTNGGGYGTKTRLTRAAVGAGAGMAFGAMFGASSHHGMGRSMMSGALIGGALGLFSGGGGW